MNNSYLFEKETISKQTINVGSTILGHLGAIVLLGLAMLSLAGCGGVGDSSSNGGSTMQIMPPKDRPDLVISSLTVSPEREQGVPFTLSVTVLNQSNARVQGARLLYFYGTTASDNGPIIQRVQVRSLNPSKTFSDSYSSIQAAGTTRYYHACVYLEDWVSGTPP